MTNRRALRALGVFGGGLLWLAVVPGWAADDGAKLYAEHCQKCHSIASQNLEATTKVASMQGSDLGEVAKPINRDEVVPFLERKTERDGKQHKGRFKGTAEQLTAILDWLDSLPAASGAK